MIHTTTSARIARILAEHPRCVAWGTSIGYVLIDTVTDREKIAMYVIRSWLDARRERISEVTLDESRGYAPMVLARVGDVKAIVLAATGTQPNEPTFYVAIELPTEAP